MMNDIEKNKELIAKHPYLLPRYEWGDEPIEDYDYSYTLLDDMPDGWRKAFGEQMCGEITEVLKKYNYLNDYRVVQIKEKLASLRWYDNGAPEGAFEEINSIINKYECLSENTCIRCGKPATKMSLGWIDPYCDECAKELEKRGMRFKDIDKL